MSTLSSASTLAEILAAYDDNASYEEDGSVAKAKAFVTACRLLIRRLPKLAGKGGNQLSLDIGQVTAEMKAASSYVRLNDTSPSSRKRRVLHPGFANLRT